MSMNKRLTMKLKKRLQQLNREPPQPKQQVQEPTYTPQTVPKPIRRPIFL